MKLKLITLFLMIMSLSSVSQNLHDFGFERSQEIIVIHNNADTLHLAWAGGLNSVHFNKIDLNFDGIMDLVGFDKHGDRLLPFLNNGSPGLNAYTYAPEYEEAFPKIYSWIQLRDYDCDGKQDIFAYGFGGIRVYRNTGDSANGLSFQLKTNLLNSLQNNMLINILVTDMDFPAIDDLDGDGDLDLLCFFGLGSYVEHHKNFSKETNGNCDYLDFRLVNKCWGKFAESEFTNSLILNINCPWKSWEEPEPEQIKHTGSTMQIIDLNNDGLSDLLLGDTDYFNIISLTNGGTTDTAVIVSQDTAFPSYNQPVDIAAIPVASYNDFDNDGHKDLVFAPFESRINIPSNYGNIWFYKGNGSTTNPQYSRQSTTFLQDRMIDLGAGSHPVIVDYDGDSLMDIVVGNYGYLDSTWYSFGNLESKFVASLALYRNVGTQQSPAFKLMTRDFGGLSQYKYVSIRPAFADLDADGDIDMIIGDIDGKLHRFTNAAGQGNPMNLTLTHPNFQNIDVGLFATPQLYDIDNDNLPDLLIGSRNTTWFDQFGTLLARKSTVQFWKNTGTASSPVFTLTSDSLGGVDATDNYLNPYYGYCVPTFFSDSSGKHHLFLGSVNGNIYHYKNINNNLNGSFLLSDTVFFMLNDSVPEKVWVGIHASPALADLNSDGYPDLIVGNFSGGFNLYLGSTPPPIDVSIPESVITSIDARLYPNPTSGHITLELNSPPGGQSIDIEIFDLGGRLISSSRLQSALRHELDVSGLGNGIYFLRLSDKSQGRERSSTLKLIRN